MKKIIILLFFFLTGMSFAQQTPEFEFPLYFEDVAGNKDTITLGYDALATDSIDSAFGEVDITNIPWKTSGLEVRISNPKNFLDSQFSTFESKKQIINYVCDNPNLKQINIFTNHWPVSMTWLSMVVDSCLEGSLVTSYQPGGWFDVPGPSSMGVIPLFGGNGLVGHTFTTNAKGIYPGSSMGYINSNGDTISAFWTVFASINMLTMGITNDEINERIQIYPNPFNEILNIRDLSALSSQNLQAELYSLDGRIVLRQNLSNDLTTINTESLEKGFYYLKIYDSNNNQFLVSSLIVKQ